MTSENQELIEQITKSIIFEKDILEAEGIPLDIMDKYLLHGYKKIKKSGEYIHEVGKNTNGLYYIKKGKIRCNFIGKDGNMKTFSIIGEGCLFGEQFVLYEHPGLFETVIIDDAELYFYDKDTILDIMKNDFQVNLFIA